MNYTGFCIVNGISTEFLGFMTFSSETGELMFRTVGYSEEFSILVFDAWFIGNTKENKYISLDEKQLYL